MKDASSLAQQFALQPFFPTIVKSFTAAFQRLDSEPVLLNNSEFYKLLRNGIGGCYFVTKYILFFILITTTGVFARLGENEVACATRYNHGQDVLQSFQDRHAPLVSGVNTTNRTYLYQGWRIRVGFVNGIAQRVEYSDAEKPSRNITEAEIAAILAANGGASAWRPVAKSDLPEDSPVSKYLFSSFNGSAWVRGDHAIAQVQFPGNKLRLESYAILKSEFGQQQKVKKKPIPAF